MSNLIIFDAFGKIKKSTNWWIIGFVGITIIGVFAIIWYNWDSFKRLWEEKSKVINSDFSATISFDAESNTLKVKTLSERKQAFSMRIINAALKEVLNNTLTKEEEDFDLSFLASGKYKCVVSNQEKMIAQDFEKA
jgi:hypothetical protein